MGSWTSLVTVDVCGRGVVGSWTAKVEPGRAAGGVARGTVGGAGAYTGVGLGAAGVGGT